MLYTIVTILAILAGILLCAIVLIQNPKGGGLNSTMGGVGQQLLGARRSTDVVEKMTWGLAAAVLLLCFSTTLFINKDVVAAGKTDAPQSEVEKRQKEQGGATPFAAPANPGVGGQPTEQQPSAPANPQ